MEKDDRVCFEFKDLHNPDITYDAGYYPPSTIDNEHLLELTQMPGGFPHFHNEKAWTVFRANATFDDILKAARPYDILDVTHRAGEPNFDDHDKWPDIRFLKELSQHPDWLAIPETGALPRFIFVVRTAGEANSGKNKEARDNLKDYFIPKRPGGSKSYPVNLRGCLYLLIHLARHIRDKCKAFLRDGTITDEDRDEWAKDHEPRIQDMPLKDLTLLTREPAKFARTILARELFVSLSALKIGLSK